MEIIYHTKFTRIGEVAREALAEKMLITFKENVPPELADYCFIHCHGELTQAVQVGDMVEFDGVEYAVTAVGEVANENLSTLGHVTWWFDGATQAQYPGTIHLAGDVPNHIGIDSALKIKRRS